MIDGIDHVVLTVRDLEATFSFYRDLLGMEVKQTGPQYSLHFGDQKINLHVAGHEFEPKADKPTVGSGDFCFHSSVPIEEVKARLEAAGVEVIVGPVRRAGAIGLLMSVYCRDPDGNLIEIANRLAAV